MRAAVSGDADRVKALITAGADVNAKDKDGDTPLVFAASADYLKMLAPIGLKPASFGAYHTSSLSF